MSDPDWIKDLKNFCFAGAYGSTFHSVIAYTFASALAYDLSPVVSSPSCFEQILQLGSAVSASFIVNMNK